MILKSVLLVEDHPSIIFLTKLAIKESQMGEDVAEALNGEEAINYIQKQIASGAEPPSLILLDINMPRMNGWEFLEAYKLFSEADRKNTIIVMLTSSMNPDDEARAATIPLVNLYRQKPITTEMMEELKERFFKV